MPIQTTFKPYCLLTLLTLLNACSTHSLDNDIYRFTRGTVSEQQEAQTFVYECQSGERFTTNIEGQMAWIFLPGETLGLPRIPSASGSKYTNGLATFRLQGDEASLIFAAKHFKNCFNNHGRAIWADANLKGVDFRAVGHKPSWVLEISEGNKLMFIDQSSGQTLHFARSNKQIERSKNRQVYLAKENGQSLLVTIHSMPCQDTMSGEAYPARVTVLLDNVSFYGCGKVLQKVMRDF